jgi:hypothetical protein
VAWFDFLLLRQPENGKLGFQAAYGFNLFQAAYDVVASS